MSPATTDGKGIRTYLGAQIGCRLPSFDELPIPNMSLAGDASRSFQTHTPSPERPSARLSTLYKVRAAPSQSCRSMM